MKILEVEIKPDEYTQRVSKAFDFAFEGKSTFELPSFLPPKDFSIGIIVGSSGSGKTQLLKEHFGYIEEESVWDSSKAIISHFDTPDTAIEKLFAVGLSSVPTLCKPFHVLYNGEKFRAEIARKIKTGAVIDEFTSVVNRETAKSLSVAISKYIRTHGLKNVVFASCHKDILEWLEPDWVFDTDIPSNEGSLFTNSSVEIDFSKRSKTAQIEIY